MTTAVDRRQGNRDTGRVASAIGGALPALIAAALLLAGALLLRADATQRGSDGWLASPRHHFDPPTSALTAQRLGLGDVPAGWSPRLGDVRVGARDADGRAVVVGIAPEGRVDAYLRDVSHAEITGVGPPGRAGSEAGDTEPTAYPVDVTLVALVCTGRYPPFRLDP